ncbi:MAG: hypothetical protein ACYCZX_19035 [Rhodospirillaceae bacterium]
MKSTALIGVILIVLGVIGLVAGHIDIITQKKVVDFGPLQVSADEHHNLPIPDIASVIALLAGAGLLFAGNKRA